MKNIFTPTFLKFFTRFIMILLVGIVGVLVFGNLNIEEKETRALQAEIAPTR